MKKCNEVMTKSPLCCLPTDLVSSVAEMMKNEAIGTIPVVENAKTRKLVGILTDYDLALMLGSEGLVSTSTQVKTIMTHKVATCHEEDDLQRALDVMSEGQLQRIIIVDDDDKVLGVVVQTDVIRCVDNDKEVVKMAKKISHTNAN